MYMHGPYTETALAAAGIHICSDGVQKDGTPELHSGGVINFPINVIPDHEHIYHAERTTEWVERWIKRYDWCDDFGPDSYAVDVWADMVIEQITAHQQAQRVANIIMHPLTMYLADGYASAQRILEHISAYQSLHMEELL